MTVRVVIPTLEPQPPVAHVQGGSGTEQADDYRSVVAVLNDQWRVIVCRVGIQWILQRCRGQIGDKPRWDGRNFCRSKAGLLDSVREHCGPIDFGALTVLTQLPDWIDH